MSNANSTQQCNTLLNNTNSPFYPNPFRRESLALTKTSTLSAAPAPLVSATLKHNLSNILCDIYYSGYITAFILLSIKSAYRPNANGVLKSTLKDAFLSLIWPIILYRTVKTYLIRFRTNVRMSDTRITTHKLSYVEQFKQKLIVDIRMQKLLPDIREYNKLHSAKYNYCTVSLAKQNLLADIRMQRSAQHNA